MKGFCFHYRPRALIVRELELQLFVFCSSIYNCHLNVNEKELDCFLKGRFYLIANMHIVGNTQFPLL